MPTSAEAEFDFHYVGFVKSYQSGHLYEMDCDHKVGRVGLGGSLEDDEDVLAEAGLSDVGKFIREEGEENMEISSLVLAPV